MDFRWEHHLVSMWHPGVLLATTAAAVLAWFIGSWTVRLLLKISDPWRRVVYLSVPVLVIAFGVYLLPAFLFEIGWRLTHPSYSHADLFMARRILLIPFVVTCIGAGRELARRRTASAA